VYFKETVWEGWTELVLG